MKLKEFINEGKEEAEVEKYFKLLIASLKKLKYHDKVVEKVEHAQEIFEKEGPDGNYSVE